MIHGRMGRGVNFFVPEDHPGIDHVRGVDTGCRLRRESRQAATGADPDRAVGLCGESVQIAIVPDQAIAAVVMVPDAPVENVDASIRTRPKPLPAVKTKKIDGRGFPTRITSRTDPGDAVLHSDAIEAPAIAVSDPHIAVLRRRQTQDHFVAQTIGPGDVAPVSSRQTEQPSGRAGPDIAVRPFDRGPELDSWHWLGRAELQRVKISHKEPVFRRRPDSVLAVEGEGKRIPPAESLHFREPLNLPRDWIETSRALRFRA